jgi:hypothetical protein
MVRICSIKNTVAKNKILKVKKKVFSSSSSESSVDVEFDDDGLQNQDDENCIICGDYGKGRETWFKCTICGKWAHKDCTNMPNDYTVPFFNAGHRNLHDKNFGSC